MAVSSDGGGDAERMPGMQAQAAALAARAEAAGVAEEVAEVAGQAAT